MTCPEPIVEINKLNRNLVSPRYDRPIRAAGEPCQTDSTSVIRRLVVQLQLLALCIIALSGSIVHGQEIGRVRSWTGTLGRSQFGVFSNNGSRLVLQTGAMRSLLARSTVSIRFGCPGTRSRCRWLGIRGTGRGSSRSDRMKPFDAESGKQISEVAASRGARLTIESLQYETAT